MFKANPMRKTNRSCLECSRRRKKCDGIYPVCGSCKYYKVQACVYRQRTKRNAVSKSTLDEVSEKLQARNEVLGRLFPGADLDKLAGKSQEELLELVWHQSGPLAVDFRTRTREQRVEEEEDDDDDLSQESDNGEHSADRQWDELHGDTTRFGDDINAISLAEDNDKHRHSYLGITSISALLRAIFRLCPAAKQNSAEQAKTFGHQRQLSMSSTVLDHVDQLREQRYIDFYFEHVHPITGMINEDEFRASYGQGTRREPSWIGLLSMVLALGSIASGSDVLHEHYYRQARSFIDLDCLGSGNLESLQALILLGGYYLHYRYSPNMAYALLGAAQRIGIALGLHRESRRSRTSVESGSQPTPAQVSRFETRRRTWWGLFCLDTWASMTLGRPTCGRWDERAMDTILPTAVSNYDYAGISLKASAEFCLVTNRIQDRISQFGRLTAQEASLFDDELRNWWNGLPDILISPTNSSPSRLITARDFMRNRYLSSRLTLMRSQLLYLANGQRHNVLYGEHQLVDICETVACEAVDAAVLYWNPNRLHVWNSAWYLFQACMVLILCMILEKKSNDERATGKVSHSSQTVAKALQTFAEMRPWMRASDRAPDIVAAIYEAVTSDAEGPQKTPSGTDGESSLFGWYDEQLTFENEPDWGSIFLEFNS